VHMLPGLTLLPPDSHQRCIGRRRPCGWALMASILAAGQPAGEERESAHAKARSAVIRIELRPEVEVKEPRVRLGDVGKLAASDPATLRRLSDLPLGEAPTAGRVVRLAQERLSRWIRARTGLRAEQIQWAGPVASDIRLATHVLSGGVIAGHATESVRAASSRTGMRTEASVRQSPPDQVIPVGRLELRARPLSEADLLAKRLFLPVEILVDGRLVRSVPVVFDLKTFGPGCVATRSQSAGEILQLSGLEEREMEWNGRDLLPIEWARREALRLRRPIQPGAVLTRAHVEPAPVVVQGDWATLHVRQGLVDLESRVEVLQDGRAGERVRVKLKSARGAVFARVTGPGTLEAVQ
jgi:flagella basal body P-ring formation protein FlgA